MSDQDELDNECKAILAWVVEQNIPIGKAVELPLPLTLVRASDDGNLQAARTRDGRLCVLMKKSTGWKGNFEGVLCCDNPLQDGELIETDVGAPYISLPGLGVFEELYIKTQHGNQIFEVYFDLN